MEIAGEAEAVNALIDAVDADFKSFKQQKIKAYPKEYYSKPVNRNRRNNYNKHYYQLRKFKSIK